MDLQNLPEVVLRAILTKLPVDSKCIMAEVSPLFAQLLQDKIFWTDLKLDTDEAFTNTVCRYVLLHSSKVEQLCIDNVSSSDSEFVVSWVDVLMSAVYNVCKVLVKRATFLTSGLFVTHTPLIQKLHLESCPNLCAFSLMQGFMCAKPRLLHTLILTGVPSLDEQSAVSIAKSCVNLATLDISGAWGPFLCLTCASGIIETCCKLKWFDFCARDPKRIEWVQCLSQHGIGEERKLIFGPFISTTVGVEQDTD